MSQNLTVNDFASYESARGSVLKASECRSQGHMSVSVKSGLVYMEKICHYSRYILNFVSLISSFIAIFFFFLIKERPLQLFTHFKQLQKKKKKKKRPQKKLRLRNRIRTHDIYDTGAVLYKLNYSRQLESGHIVNS